MCVVLLFIGFWALQGPEYYTNTYTYTYLGIQYKERPH